MIWKPGPREIWRIQTKIESICRIKTEKEIENRKNWYGNLRYREFAILQLYSVRNLTQTHKSRFEFQTGLRLENISFCTIMIQFFSEISVTSVWALFCQYLVIKCNQCLYCFQENTNVRPRQMWLFPITESFHAPFQTSQVILSPPMASSSSWSDIISFVHNLLWAIILENVHH